jgi:hypothetical protein
MELNMDEFVPETKRPPSFTLEPNATFSFPFRLPNLGNIAIMWGGVIGSDPGIAPLRRRDDDPVDPPVEDPRDPPGPVGPPPKLASRKFELFSPSSNVDPVVNRVDAPPEAKHSSVNYLAREGAKQNWLVKVTNLSTEPATFYLAVTYPGTVPILYDEQHRSLVNQLIKDRLRARLHISREGSVFELMIKKDDGSFADPILFEIPELLEFKRTYGFITVHEYPNDINAESMAISLENATPPFPFGQLRMEALFEENGKEILGTWHGNMYGIRLLFQLRLIFTTRMVTYDTRIPGVSFSVRDMDMIGFPDTWYQQYIFDYKTFMVTTVNEKLFYAFREPRIVDAITSILTELAFKRVGLTRGEIWHFSVDGDYVRVRVAKR